ncbi:YdbL family protein [Ectothiorhodospira mobilis]|uniref:YdbL family protein n=1 Tax=Ectothiorhodospira mobilis TaxID=195064 RepID=UPI001EE801CC|nr:YdbL family protein [Ectothiorhodospira mobilis]MCG5534852.1 YdbL family protein [Ectothiorhodospira mobilis]
MHLPVLRLFPAALAALLTAALLTACVTVNIYFPAAAAEDAARTIVRDVLGAEGDGERKQEVPDAEPGPEALRDAAGRLLVSALDVLVPPAHAQSPDIDIRTPAINALRASLRARNDQMRPHFRSGAIGLTRDGNVAVRDLKQVPLRERSQVQQLVAEENADRNALYREIARANGHPEWEDEIRETFARVWVEEAPAGYWYQDRQGRWQRK